MDIMCPFAFVLYRHKRNRDSGNYRRGLKTGGNYFCVNNETGKVYFWFADDGLYYLITDSVEEFCKLLL